MIFGYERIWPSGPKKQAAELDAAGCERVFTDDTPRRSSASLPERAKLIRQLCPGDVVVMVAPEVLGRGAGDIADALAAIIRTAEGGVTIRDLSTGQDFTPTERDQPFLDFVARATDGSVKRRTAKANLASRGKAGAPRKLQGKRLAAARAAWFDPNEPSGPAVAERFGVSYQTMHSYFGPRSGSGD